MSVRVVERAGIKLQYVIPGFKEEEKCDRADCFLHESGGHGDHSREGVVYRGECVTCANTGPSSQPDESGRPKLVAQRCKKSSWYIGETARAIYVRGKEHIDAMRKPQTNLTNAFAKHKVEYHLLEEPEFKLTMLRSFTKPLQRQLLEGLEIRHGESTCDVLMNSSKLDHHAPAIARVHLTTSVAEKPQQAARLKRKSGESVKGPRGKRKKKEEQESGGA